MSWLDGDGHGGRVAAAADELGCGVDDVLDLSSTLNHFGPDVTTLVATLGRHAVYYPDPTRATAVLSAELGVEPGRLVVTNGAAEAIVMLTRLFPGGDVRELEFGLYRKHLSEVRAGAPRWRTNPSSPLGELAASDATAEFWDESHYPMATGRWTRGDDAWVITSLTKVWRCAGLRLGFVIAPSDDDAERLRRAQPEWSVNGIALAAVESLLGLTDLEGWRDAIARNRSSLVDVLRARGLDARETDAGWALVDDGADVVEPLFRQRVLVRELANYGLPGVVRIAVPDDRGLERLEAALQTIDP